MTGDRTPHRLCADARAHLSRRFLAPRPLRGRQCGAHLSNPFIAVFETGSVASWVVLLGPYGLYLIFKGLRSWWRASANLA